MANAMTKFGLISQTNETFSFLRTPSSDLPVQWARFDDQTIVWCNSDETWKRVTQNVALDGIGIDPPNGRDAIGQLFLVIQVGREFQSEYPDVNVVLDKGRYLVVDMDHAPDHSDHNHECWTVLPLPANSTVIHRADSPDSDRGTPWIQSLVSKVSSSKYNSALTTLVNRPTRHSFSQHFADAGNWASQQFEQLGYQTKTEQLNVGSRQTFNVVAERQGNAVSDRKIVIVCAHLDSINSSGGPNALAPGADDNASGCAGVLEIGRVLASLQHQNDLRLILFGGEEQGLFGSKAYVDKLSTEERSRIVAVINMDMIGTVNTETPTVLLEGADLSQPLMNELADAASSYTSLSVLQSLNPFASDHVSFLNASMPAVLTIEGTDSANSNVHTANDTLTHIDLSLAVDIVKMNLATTAKFLGQATHASSGSNRASGPVVAWGPNRLDAFVIGTNSAMYHKWWNGSSWGPSVTGYQAMGGQIVGKPVAVAWDSNRLDAFVRGTNMALYHKWWNGSSWGPSVTGYQYMGGRIIEDPEVVSWGPKRLDVFVVGTNSALYHKWWNGSSWGPSVTGYEFMGGGIVGRPRAVAWGPKRLDVFVIGMNSALYHKWWNGSSWGPSVTGYEYMGGRIQGDPEVVSWGPNRLDVFVKGMNSGLYHKWWNGSSWGPSVTGYQYMGGRIKGQPTAVSWGPNRLDLFVVGMDSALYHKAWDGTSWKPSVTGWNNLGGRCIGTPRVVAWGPNRLDVFVIGTNSALYHKWWDGSSWGPSTTGYQYLGGQITEF